LLSRTSITVVDPALLLRAVEVYEVDRLDFAEAYLVACAESSGVGQVASLDRSIDRAWNSPASRAEPTTTRAEVVITVAPRSSTDW